MLAQLRADLTTNRKQRPQAGGLSWLGGKDQRYRAALAPAAKTNAFAEVLAAARAYWGERDPPQAPATTIAVEAASASLEAGAADDEVDLTG